MKAQSPEENVSGNSLNPSGPVSSSLALLIKDFHVLEEGSHGCVVLFKAGNTT